MNLSAANEPEDHGSTVGLPETFSKTVIVPFGGNGSPEHLQACVDSLRADSCRFDEVIVVLDGVGRIQNEQLESQLSLDGFRVLCLPEQVGPAAARNAAVAAARSETDLLVFVDADVVVMSGFGALIDDVFREHPQIDACFGSYDDEPASCGFFAQYRNLLHHYVHQESGTEAESFWAGCGVIRRHVFLKSGGFCSSYARSSIEDVELGMRLRSQGTRIRMEPTLFVKHLKGWTMASMLRTDLRDRAIPWVRMLWRFRKVPNSLNTSNAHRAKLVIATAAPCVVLLMGPSAWQYAWGGMAVVAFLFLNRGFLEFLRKKRGGLFMVAAVFWQWVFYIECGMAIAWVTIEIMFGLRSFRPVNQRVDSHSKSETNDNLNT